MKAAFGVKLRDLNPHLICVLCGGYLIEATTIVECFHSFCRSCIIRYLETSSSCPICDVQVHKAKPHLNIREDQTLQDLVYKLVPGLYHRELSRRTAFNQEHPQSSSEESSSSESWSSSDDEPPSKSRRNDVISFDYPPAISEKENISVCLQLCDRSPPFKNSSSTTSPHKDENILDKKYLLCPATFPLGLMKKFVQAKFNLAHRQEVEFYFSDESLSNQCRLMDIAYIYHWKKFEPLKLFYIVQESPCKVKTKQEQNVSSIESKNSRKPSPDKTPPRKAPQPSPKSPKTKIASPEVEHPPPVNIIKSAKIKSSYRTTVAVASPKSKRKLSTLGTVRPKSPEIKVLSPPKSPKSQSPCRMVSVPLVNCERALSAEKHKLRADSIVSSTSPIDNLAKGNGKSKVGAVGSQCTKESLVDNSKDKEPIMDTKSATKSEDKQDEKVSKYGDMSDSKNSAKNSSKQNESGSKNITSITKQGMQSMKQLPECSTKSADTENIAKKHSDIGRNPNQNIDDNGKLVSNDGTSEQRSALDMRETDRGARNKQQQNVHPALRKSTGTILPPQPTNVNKQMDQSATQCLSDLNTNSKKSFCTDNPMQDLPTNELPSTSAVNRIDTECSPKTVPVQSVAKSDTVENPEDNIATISKSSLQQVCCNTESNPATFMKMDSNSPSKEKQCCCADEEKIEKTPENTQGKDLSEPSPKKTKLEHCKSTNGTGCGENVDTANDFKSPNKETKSVEVQTDNAPENNQHFNFPEVKNRTADGTKLSPTTNQKECSQGNQPSSVNLSSPKSPDSSTGPSGQPEQATSSRRRKSSSSNFAKKYRLPAKSPKCDVKVQNALRSIKLKSGSKTMATKSDPYLFMSDDNHSGNKSRRTQSQEACSTTELSRADTDEPDNRNALAFLEEYVNFVNNGDERNEEPITTNQSVPVRHKDKLIAPTNNNVVLPDFSNSILTKAYIPLKDIVSANTALQNRINQGVNIRTISGLFDHKKNSQINTSIKVPVAKTPSSSLPIQEHSIKSTTEHKQGLPKEVTKKIPPLKLKISKASLTPEKQKSTGETHKNKSNGESGSDRQPRIFLRISKASIPAVKRSLSINCPVAEKSPKRHSPKKRTRTKSDAGEVFRFTATQANNSAKQQSTKRQIGTKTKGMSERAVPSTTPVKKELGVVRPVVSATPIKTKSEVTSDQYRGLESNNPSADKCSSSMLTTKNSPCVVSVSSDNKEQLQSRIDKINALKQDLDGRSPQSGLDLLSRASEKFSPIPETGLEDASYPITDQTFVTDTKLRSKEKVDSSRKLNVTQSVKDAKESAQKPVEQDKSTHETMTSNIKTTKILPDKITEESTFVPSTSVPAVKVETSLVPTKVDQSVLPIVTEHGLPGVKRPPGPFQPAHTTVPSPLMTLGMYVGARHLLPPHISYHGLVYPLNGLVMVSPATSASPHIPQRALSVPDVPVTPPMYQVRRDSDAVEATVSEKSMPVKKPTIANPLQSRSHDDIRKAVQGNAVHSNALQTVLNAQRLLLQHSRLSGTPLTRRPCSEPPSSHVMSHISSQKEALPRTKGGTANSVTAVNPQANGYDAPLELTTKKTLQ